MYANPTHLRAERAAVALLGGLLIDPEAIDEVSSILRIDDLPTERTRAVYAAMLALRDRGIPGDFVAVCCELETRGTLEMVGEANLTTLINRCPTSVHVEHYARLVAEAGRERRAPNGIPKGALAI